MSDFDQGMNVRSDDVLEQLLKHALPRPVPSKDDEAAVRQAVHTEWRRVSGRRRSRHRSLSFAIAATVLVVVFSVFSFFRVPVVEVVQVASIEKSFGSIYLLGEKSELRETQDLSDVLSGQTIVTGNQAGMALAWGSGGSLRVDENTRVEFTQGDSVYLKFGRIYFDSAPSVLVVGITAGGIDDFVVHTDHGAVAHIGTQFMAGVNDASLTVSVREGQVAVDGKYHRRVANSGEQLTLSGRQQPTILSISRSGESWDWVTHTAPNADVDGKTLHEYLLWACRELGLEIAWQGQAEQVARDAILHGTIDRDLAEAMKLHLATTALEYRIDGGVIYVSNSQ